jgi:hypothetical protein
MVWLTRVAPATDSNVIVDVVGNGFDTTSGSASLAKRQFQNDLDNLRDLMEARAL